MINYGGPDWTDSKTGELELWKNPMISQNDRLLIADGAVSFRNDVIKNLRGQIENLKKDLSNAKLPS